MTERRPVNNPDQMRQLLQELAHRGANPPAPAELPPGLDPGRWVRDDYRGLWIPTAGLDAAGHARPGRAAGVLPGGMRGQTYITAREILDHSLSPQEVLAALASVRAADVATHVASILAETESPDRGRGADLRWARRLLTGEPLARAERRLQAGSRLLARQVLLNVLKLALVVGEPGPPNASPAGVREATLAMLSLAEHLGAARTDGEERWGGIPVGLALEIVANQSFYSTTPELMLVGRFGQVWLETAAAKARPRQIAAPEELYRSMTGIDWEVGAAVVLALHSQAVLHGYVRFPSEFFDRLGLPRDQVDATLDRLCVPQIELAQLVETEAVRLGFDWTFNPLRRYPLVRLDDDTVLVHSPRLLLERAFDGVALYWEVVDGLRTQSDRGTEDRFSRVHTDAAESYAVEVARAIAPPLGAAHRVFTEKEMQNSWRRRGANLPSVCDFVIDYGDAWLCVEVTTSRLTEAAVAGHDLAALDSALDKIITDRKAGQLASTIRLLKRRESDLTKRPAQHVRRYIPVLLTMYDFPVNNATMTEARGRLKAMDLLQPPIAPLVILSMTGFEMVEALAVPGGHAAADLIREWADSTWANGPIDSYLHDRHMPLTYPDRLRERFEAISDRLYRRMERGAADSAAEGG